VKSRTFSRALSTLAALPLCLLGSVVAPPAASAAGYPTCPTDRLVYSFDTLGGFRNDLAVYNTTSPTTTVVCFTVSGFVAKGTLIVRRPLGPTAPTVTPGTSAGVCTVEVLHFSAPTEFLLSVGADATQQYVCLGIDGTTVTLAYTSGDVGPLPSVELWRAGTNTDLDWAACIVAARGLPSTETCQRTAGRIL
jgi:hypothetical protein